MYIAMSSSSQHTSLDLTTDQTTDSHPPVCPVHPISLLTSPNTPTLPSTTAKICRTIKTDYECEDCHKFLSSGTEAKICHAGIQFGGYGKCLLEEKPKTIYTSKDRCSKCRERLQERQERERKRREREERERRRREVEAALPRLDIGGWRRAEEHRRRERNDPYLDPWRE
jgi:hypothetical protein